VFTQENTLFGYWLKVSELLASYPLTKNNATLSPVINSGGIFMASTTKKQQTKLFWSEHLIAVAISHNKYLVAPLCLSY